MTSTMMMERTAMGMPGMAPAGTMATAAPGFLMVPRCTFKFEKVQGGAKVTCVCDDPMARSMMQNLCQALTGGMCGWTCTFNGVAACSCSWVMGMTRCEATDTGCTVTCTSGDQKCCEMIQACCDCVAAMCAAGCVCCLTINGTPVCCGTSTTETAKAKR